MSIIVPHRRKAFQPAGGGISFDLPSVERISFLDSEARAEIEGVVLANEGAGITYTSDDLVRAEYTKASSTDYIDSSDNQLPDIESGISSEITVVMSLALTDVAAWESDKYYMHYGEWGIDQAFGMYAYFMNTTGGINLSVVMRASTGGLRTVGAWATSGAVPTDGSLFLMGFHVEESSGDLWLRSFSSHGGGGAAYLGQGLGSSYTGTIVLPGTGNRRLFIGNQNTGTQQALSEACEIEFIDIHNTAMTPAQIDSHYSGHN